MTRVWVPIQRRANHSGRQRLSPPSVTPASRRQRTRQWIPRHQWSLPRSPRWTHHLHHQLQRCNHPNHRHNLNNPQLRRKWPREWKRSSNINHTPIFNFVFQRGFGRRADNRKLNRVWLSDSPIRQEQVVNDYYVNILFWS